MNAVVKERKLTETQDSAVGTDAIVLAVRIEGSIYAVPIESVEEVLPALPIEAVPYAPAYVRGVVFVRGHLIPVISAAERLGIAEHRPTGESHIVCLRAHDRLIGVEVDEALELIRFHEGTVVGADELGARRGFFTGVVEFGGIVVRLLDPEGLVSDEERRELSKLPTVGSAPRRPAET